MDVKTNAHLTRLVAPLILDGLGRQIASDLWAPIERRRIGPDVARTDFNPHRPRTASDPYPEYERLLAGPPVHYNPDRNFWVVSHYAAVKEALRTPEVFSSVHSVVHNGISVETMITSDGDRHTELRKIGLGSFSRGAMQAWEPTVDSLAKELVEDLLARPGEDVVANLAIPMPVKMIATILGIPPEDFADFRHWSQQLIRTADLRLGINRDGWFELRDIVKSVGNLYSYFQRRFESGALTTTGSALGRAQEASATGALDADDLFFFAALLLLAGNETTTNLLGPMFLNLAEHPDQYDAVRADPDLIPSAIEEQVRHHSPVQGFFRRTLRDHELAGTPIPGGAKVLLLFGAANRDWRAFESPEEFRVDRNPIGHLGFGHGVHLCLGASLARMEGQAVLRHLIQTIDRIEVTGAAVWTTNSALRGLAQLPVRLSAA